MRVLVRRQSINQSINQYIDQSNDQSINRSINQYMDQSNDQSINRSTDHSDYWTISSVELFSLNSSWLQLLTIIDIVRSFNHIILSFPASGMNLQPHRGDVREFLCKLHSPVVSLIIPLPRKSFWFFPQKCSCIYGAKKLPESRIRGRNFSLGDLRVRWTTGRGSRKYPKRQRCWTRDSSPPFLAEARLHPTHQRLLQRPWISVKWKSLFKIFDYNQALQRVESRKKSTWQKSRKKLPVSNVISMKRASFIPLQLSAVSVFFLTKSE